MLVLDLDETLIHSHHDAMLRPTVKPGTPPDFVLKVTIDKHPVRFFVHKRPHVDYFLDTVSLLFYTRLTNEVFVKVKVTRYYRINQTKSMTFENPFLVL